ncbi:MAG TPA: zf-TFIIB domain-containing protein [Polyangiaceae bacterium]|jgi:Zn-finger nucleic acid-binding protein
MRCPRDGTELVTRVYEADVEIDECPLCKGKFLDHGELESIQSAVEKDAPRKARLDVDTVRDEFEAEAGETQPLVDCPRCGKQMERRRYGLGSMTVIDACVDGDGLWLDRGELEELELFYARSQQEMQIPVTWRIWAAVRGTFAKRRVTP